MRELAVRKDSYYELSEAYDRDQQDMSRMLKIAAHRRACHMHSHRGCKRCTPEKCSECKDDALAAWSGKRWALQREANAILKAGEVPRPAPVSDDDLLLLLLLLA